LRCYSGATDTNRLTEFQLARNNFNYANYTEYINISLLIYT